MTLLSQSKSSPQAFSRFYQRKMKRIMCVHTTTKPLVFLLVQSLLQLLQLWLWNKEVTNLLTQACRQPSALNKYREQPYNESYCMFLCVRARVRVSTAAIVFKEWLEHLKVSKWGEAFHARMGAPPSAGTRSLLPRNFRNEPSYWTNYAQLGAA